MQPNQRQAIADLQEMASRTGRAPSQAQWDELGGKPRARTVAGWWPGGWREALSAAGLQGGWTNQQLLDRLAGLALQIGRNPTARDINRSADLPSASIYLRRFGSLAKARAAAGLGVEESIEQTILNYGIRLSLELGHMPSWQEWIEACKGDKDMPSQWSVYRRFGGDRGAWKMFHYCLMEEAVRLGIQIEAFG